MTKKEYIVGLNRGVDFESFNNEMLSEMGAEFIPNRPVEIANFRPGSERLTHYYLTDNEAAALRNDPRVYCVEIPPQHRDDIKIHKMLTQTGNFSKTTSNTGFINWGLRRINAATNPYEGNTVSGGYQYTLDGTGVDVVIQDSGIEKTHPDFTDINGNSRIQEINWYTASGIPGTMPPNHYSDFDGHGTHVAGIVAGKTYGWAKNSRIYAVKVDGLDTGEGGIPVTDCFDIIKQWHNNKPVDAVTGYKRPTVVNMSWGYISAFTNITGGSYRGTTWTGTSRRTDYGMIGFNIGLLNFFGIRIPSVDVEIQEMIDAGIHVVISAGNTFQKIDVASGLDYNNYYTNSVTGNVYYHRGSSPFDDEAIIVGNIDTALSTIDDKEQKQQSSCAGPGVTVYAPGTNIVSTISSTNLYTSGAYLDNPVFSVANLTGTSMSAPQVAGVMALYLQLNPGYAPSKVRNWVTAISKTNQIYTTGNTDDYTNNRSILGSTNRFMFNPFASPYGLTISGS